MGKILLNQTQICELLSVSRPTIAKYHGHGLPRIKRGLYDGAAVVAWFTTHQVNLAITGQNNVANKDGQTPEVRLLEARAIKIERENAEKEGKVVGIDKVEAFFQYVATTFTNAFESMGARLGAQLAGIDEPAEIQDTIWKDSRECRRQVAQKIDELDLDIFFDVEES